MVSPEECVVLDADGLKLSMDETIQIVADLNPKAVGLTLTTYTFDMIENISQPLAARGFPIFLSLIHIPSPRDATLSRMPSSA